MTIQKSRRKKGGGMQPFRAAMMLLVTTVIAGTLLVIATVGALVVDRIHVPVSSSRVLAGMQWSWYSQVSKSSSAPEFIGHRGSAAIKDGEHRFKIENNLEGIKRGIDAGINWTEIDIRLTKDGQLVLFHDESIKEKDALELTLDQLAKEAGCPVMTLDEAFEEFRSPIQKWIFDVKAEEACEPFLLWIQGKVKSHKLAMDQLVVFGEKAILESLNRSSFNDPGYRKGFIVSWKSNSNKYNVIFHPDKIIADCKALGSTCLVLPVGFASERLVSHATGKGLKVWCYGTDNVDEIVCLHHRGVEGFIVDRPSEVVDAVREVFDPSRKQDSGR